MSAAMNYTLTADQLPEQGVVVETVSPGGIVQRLKRKGNLWLFEDGSMYVYYTPLMWRPLAAARNVEAQASLPSVP